MLADAETSKLTDDDLRAYSTEYSASRYSPPLVFADKWEFGNFVDECAKWGGRNDPIWTVNNPIAESTVWAIDSNIIALPEGGDWYLNSGYAIHETVHLILGTKVGHGREFMRLLVKMALRMDPPYGDRLAFWYGLNYGDLDSWRI
jgi:hypothetical protein